MKYIFLLLLVFFCQKFSLAQNPDSLSKMIFEYSVGRDATINSGIYLITEIIELSKKSGDLFTTSAITRISSWHNEERTQYRYDTTQINISKIRKTKLEVGDLIKQLNTSEDNFNIDFILPKLTNPSRKDIIAVSEKYNKKQHFQKNYLDKKDRRKAIREMKNFYQLDSFLNIIKNDSLENTFFSHYFHNLSIVFVGRKDTSNYRCRFYEPFGQPFKKIIKNLKSGLVIKKISNLKINLAIQGLIPDISLLLKAIDLNAIKESYINWYIDTKM